MPETMHQIIALEKEIVSTQTGARAYYHVVKQYSVSHIGEGSSAATFAGYVSREMYEAGKDPLLFVTAQIPSAPTSGDIANLPTWFALQLLKVASGHDFVGATPVYAEPAPSVVFEQAVGPGGDFAVAHQGVGSGDEEPAA